jgi:hypothetical protein
MRPELLILVFGALAAAPAAARPAPAGPVVATEAAPIERVVVYSDQARVYRATRAVLGADAAPVTLAALPPAAWPDTVRVECASAEIANVEVSRTWARLPRQAEGKALLAQIERAQDQARALDDEQRLLQTELGLVESLQPLSERKRPDKEPPAMFVETWRRVIGWADGRGARIRARLAAMPALRLALEQKLIALRVEGRKLLPDAASGPALRVVVTLRGKPGTHDVTLSYVVGGVRWVPAYDLRYDPQNPGVDATYYAVVSQSTGEDWRQAKFAFSTILPSNLLAVPELPTWTLGKTTSFTPTPRERWEQKPVPWRAADAAPEPDGTLVELEQAVGRLPLSPEENEERARAITVDQTMLFPTENHLQSLTQAARNQRDVIKLNCVNDKLVQVQTLRRMAVQTEQEARVATDEGARQHAQAKLRVIVSRVRALRQEGNQCVGQETAYDQRLQELEKNVDKTKEQVYRSRMRTRLLRETVLSGKAEAAAQAPPPAEPGPAAGRDEDRDGVADEEDAKEVPRKRLAPARSSEMHVLAAAPAARRGRRLFSFGGGSTRAPTPSETVPWTDTGYRPPYLDPDLPAASAKGHRFTMDAPGRHSVVANGVPVRVPLLREHFAVSPVYKIVPGRSKAAYLTAEIFNSSGRPVLRGHANLFTGATYSGQTKLETAVPGAKLLLPLGVDEGVKVNRMIDQKTAHHGVVFKDDVSDYTVTIEIANHRRHQIRVELEDQLPITANKDTKVEGFAASPAMTGPALDGKIGWSGTVGAGSVQKLTFKFRIVRPKNWEIRQNDG